MIANKNKKFTALKPHTSHQCRVGGGRTVADCSCPAPLHPFFRRWIAYSHRLFPLSMSLRIIPQPFSPRFWLVIPSIHSSRLPTSTSFCHGTFCCCCCCCYAFESRWTEIATAGSVLPGYMLQDPTSLALLCKASWVSGNLRIVAAARIWLYYFESINSKAKCHWGRPIYH